jgi:hypothetical protein
VIHVFFDPIKDGSFTKRERLDCTVRALAIATGMTYAQAHSLCERRGRRYGCRFHTDKLVGTGVFDGAPVKRHGTVMSFLKKFPVGRFYVSTRRHAFAVIDGRIWDTYFDPEKSIGKCRVEAAWRVKPVEGA